MSEPKTTGAVPEPAALGLAGANALVGRDAMAREAAAAGPDKSVVVGRLPVVRDAHGRIVAGSGPLNPKGRLPEPTLTELVRTRLKELAVEVPFAREQCERLERDASTSTVAEVLVDLILMAAFGGKVELVRELWARLEGKVPDRIAGPDGEALPLSLVVQRITAVLEGGNGAGIEPIHALPPGEAQQTPIVKGATGTGQRIQSPLPPTKGASVEVPERDAGSPQGDSARSTPPGTPESPADAASGVPGGNGGPGAGPRGDEQRADARRRSERLRTPKGAAVRVPAQNQFPWGTNFRAYIIRSRREPEAIAPLPACGKGGLRHR